MKRVVFLGVFLLSLRIVGIAVPDLSDPSEARYALIAREMARSGDVITLRLPTVEGVVPFLGKPPLHFWSSALSIRLFGESPLAYRLPSLVAALLCLLALARIGGRLLGSSALRGTILLASSGAFVVLSGYLLVDMTLTLFVTLANLWRLELGLESDPGRRRRLALLIGCALGGAFLTKGPVGLAFFVLPATASFALAMRGRPANAPRFVGTLPLVWIAVPLLAINLPWFLLAERDNPGFLEYFFVNENWKRYLQRDYGDRYGVGHVYPYGSALVMFLACAFPWSLLALRRRLWGPATDRNLLVSRHALAGCLLCVAFFCFSRQLLFTYLLPAVPLFCLGFGARFSLDERPRRARSLAWTLLLIIACGAFHVIDGRSTRAVLEEARAVAREHGLSGELCFARKTPNSALFHAEGELQLRAKKGWREQLEQDLNSKRDLVYFLTPHDFDQLPDDLASRLQVVREFQRWKIFIIRR